MPARFRISAVSRLLSSALVFSLAFSLVTPYYSYASSIDDSGDDAAYGEAADGQGIVSLSEIQGQAAEEGTEGASSGQDAGSPASSLGGLDSLEQYSDYVSLSPVAQAVSIGVSTYDLYTASDSSGALPTTAQDDALTWLMLNALGAYDTGGSSNRFDAFDFEQSLFASLLYDAPSFTPSSASVYGYLRSMDTYMQNVYNDMATLVVYVSEIRELASSVDDSVSYIENYSLYASNSLYNIYLYLQEYISPDIKGILDALGVLPDLSAGVVDGNDKLDAANDSLDAIESLLVIKKNSTTFTLPQMLYDFKNNFNGRANAWDEYFLWWDDFLWNDFDPALKSLVDSDSGLLANQRYILEAIEGISFEASPSDVDYSDILQSICDKIDDLVAGSNASDVAGSLLDMIRDFFGAVDLASKVASLSESLSTAFPFCLIFEVVAILSVLSADAVAPSFSVDLPVGSGSTYAMQVDLSEYDSVASVVRACLLALYCIGLFSATRQWLFKGSGDE